MKLELTRECLLVYLANHNTIRGAHPSNIIVPEVKSIKIDEMELSKYNK